MKTIKLYSDNGLQAGVLELQNYGNLIRDGLYKFTGNNGNIIYDVGLIKRETSLKVSIFIPGMGDYEFTIKARNYKVLI